MTFQIGCVGSDGFLIASDRNAVKDEGDTTEVRKILISEDERLVCSFCGDEIAPYMAQRMAYGQIPFGELSSGPKVSRFLQSFYTLADPTDYSKVILFAGVPNAPPDVPALWRITFPQGKTVPLPISDRECIGTSSFARYLMERHYRPNLSVDQLTELAAHAILEANRMNRYIKGLDVLIAKRGSSPRFLDSGELDNLRERSRALHQKWGEALFPASG